MKKTVQFLAVGLMAAALAACGTAPKKQLPEQNSQSAAIHSRQSDRSDSSKH